VTDLGGFKTPKSTPIDSKTKNSMNVFPPTTPGMFKSNSQVKIELGIKNQQSHGALLDSNIKIGSGYATTAARGQAKKD
jgi:hypothetical protein